MQFPTETNAISKLDKVSDISNKLIDDEEANHSKKEIEEDLLIVQENDEKSSLIYSSEREQVIDKKYQENYISEQSEDNLEEELKVFLIKLKN